MNATKESSALQKAITTKSNKASSSKTPKYYNEQKNLFIEEMSTHPDNTIRLAAAESEFIPAKILTSMLEFEANEKVIRAIIMNPRVSLLAIKLYLKNIPSDHPFHFDDDLINAIAIRTGANVEEKSADDNNKDDENLPTE